MVQVTLHVPILGIAGGMQGQATEVGRHFVVRCGENIHQECAHTNLKMMWNRLVYILTFGV